MIPSLMMWLAIALMLVGCEGHIVVDSRADDTRDKQEQWYRDYTKLANQYTDRTYQCMIEMYSLAYYPVNSGPVCRESCAVMKQVNDMADSAPTFIGNPAQYHLKESNVCRTKKPHRSKQ